VFHVDLLIPHHETDAYGETYSQPPPELIDGEEEYEVEEIITDRYDKRRRKRQFLVKWKGYPVSENSWVNEKDLHAPELLTEYRSRT
jgi:chromatin segregation and condensation protein Rec8/ScpA/Scc1 (kleisin family)